MYVPPRFRIDDESRLREFVSRNGFGLLITSGEDGLQATACPMIWRREGGEHGEVWGHVARANPQWRHFNEVGEALLVFQGPHAYVSPRYYRSEVNVPTRNYTAVQLRGPIAPVTATEELAELLTALTDEHEGGRSDPWRFDPEHPKLAPMMRAVVGFRVEVTSIDGKFKLNQNKSGEDREGVVEVLEGSDSEVERGVAELMREQLGRDEGPR